MSSTAIYINKPSSNTWNIPNTAFVSPTGNNATAVIGDGNKPYASIQTAMQYSAKVIILPGTYAENIVVFSNDRFVYAMPGVTIIGGFSVSSNISKFTLVGKCRFEGISTSFAPIQVTSVQASNVEVYFEFDYIDVEKEAFNIANNTKLTLRGNSIRAKGNFTGATSAVICDNANVTIFLEEDFVISKCILLKNQNIVPFAGRLEINCRTFKMDNRLVSGLGNGSMIYDQNQGSYKILLNCDIHELSGASTARVFYKDTFGSGNNPRVEINGNTYSNSADFVYDLKGSITFTINGNIHSTAGSVIRLMGNPTDSDAPVCLITNSIINSLYQIQAWEGSVLEINNCNVQVSSINAVPGKTVANCAIYTDDYDSVNMPPFMSNGCQIVLRDSYFQGGINLIDDQNCTYISIDSYGCFMSAGILSYIGVTPSGAIPTSYPSLTVPYLNPPI